ncbi:MAG: Bax inhibitor-1/YccA family protein [Phycisphaerae bacterium]
MSYLDNAPDYTGDVAAQQAFVVKVYGWMTAGLMLTAIIAKLIALSVDRGVFAGVDPRLMIVLVLVQLGIALGMRWCLDKVPAIVITAMYVLYAAITGVFFSIYFLLFTEASIASTFLVCSATFGVMSLYGYFTKRDLTGIGQLCLMALIGLIIASIVNIFMASSMLYWATTYIGILIFVGLTAYDTQKMKYMYLAGAAGSAQQQKAAILAAFELYLDFVILFQYLLRLLGRRR